MSGSYTGGQVCKVGFGVIGARVVGTFVGFGVGEIDGVAEGDADGPGVGLGVGAALGESDGYGGYMTSNVSEMV